MSGAEVTEWLKLFQVAGNAGIVVLTIIAVNVARAFLKALRDIVDTMQANQIKTVAALEDIKRAMVAINPRAETIFQQRAQERAQAQGS